MLSETLRPGAERLGRLHRNRTPVSYTHLDVYKRQVYSAGLRREYKHYETLSFLNTVHGGSVKNFMAALFDGDELGLSLIHI